VDRQKEYDEGQHAHGKGGNGKERPPWLVVLHDSGLRGLVRCFARILHRPDGEINPNMSLRAERSNPIFFMDATYEIASSLLLLAMTALYIL